MTHTLGSPDSPIWFIINSPTEAEFKSGKLFNSAAGKILTASIRGNRVNKYFATCLRRSRKDSTAEILNNVIAIKNLYKQFKPAVVVLLGDEPLSLFESISSGKVANWRGSFLASSESFPSSLVLPTYTPETCRRQRFVDKDSHPGQYEMLLWLDIEKACKQLSPSAPTLFFPETKVLESSSEAKALLKQFISEGKPISYDLETYQPYSAHFVDCIGLANSLDIGFCIPFYFFNGQRPCPSFPYDDLAEIFELLAILMNSSHIEKVAQNSQFDSGCLQAHYGIETHNLTFDTMVAQQNIFCDLPKNLGCLTSIYTNTPYHKHLMGEARYVYCALDAVQNLLVRQGEEEQMKEWDIFEHYKTITAPTIQPILQMQLSGVKVDESKVEDVRSWRHEEVSAIQSAFDSVLPFSINPKGKYKINLNSPDQKKFFFNELLGCKPMKVKGKITCNKSFLKKIEAEGASFQKPFAHLAIKYSEANKDLTSTNKPLRNGRIHSKYGIGGETDGDEEGTLSGRLNSKACDMLPVFDPAKQTYVDSGRNLQNLKKGFEREILIPDEDEIFIHVDLCAAEAWLNAMAAREGEMIKILQSGVKIHNWLLDIMKDKFPIETQHFTYKGAKQFVHSLNYGVEVLGLMQNSALYSLNGQPLPNYVVAWTYSFYHQTFPGIKRRHTEIRRMLKEKRMSVSPLGRKWQIIAPFTHKDYRVEEKAFAYPNQSTIGELTCLAANKLYYRGLLGKPWCFPALNAHDGLAIRCKENDRSDVIQMVIDAFNIPFTSEDGTLTLTIPIEISWGRNYGDEQNAFIHNYA